jgi:hypothetical protein
VTYTYDSNPRRATQLAVDRSELGKSTLRRASMLALEGERKVGARRKDFIKVAALGGVARGI